MPQIDFTSELTYIILLFGLFVVPRMLQGIGLPTAITSLALGGALGLGLGLFQHDPTITLLSTLGIVSLFLFAGLELHREDFSFMAIGTGMAFTVLTLPFRVIAVSAHRKFALRERFAQTLRISVRILPTLVFTLVLAGILRESYDIPSWLFGGLVVYAFLNPVLPSLFKLAPPPEYTMPPLVTGAHLPLEPRPAATGTDKP